MSVTLRAADLKRMQRLSRTLLSPLDFAELDDWRRSVCSEARDLLGADTVTFQLPNLEAQLFLSEGFDHQTINSYPELIAPLASRVGLWERKVALGTCNRAALWGRYLSAYERSAYYHEVVVPHRGFDALLLNVGMDSRRAAADTVASLLFHHDRPGAGEFGPRGTAIAELILPLFEAGVRAYAAVARRRAGFDALLDTLSDGVQLSNCAGEIVHENPALFQMMARETEADRALLRQRMHSLAQSARGLCEERCHSAEPPDRRSLSLRASTPQATYRMVGSLVDRALSGAEPHVMVLLERVTPELPTATVIREHFALTRKEAEVALLLARGKGTTQIAEALFLSPHTVRRHTESIFRKLNVRTRSEVAPKLIFQGPPG
jgi:DNA-binding CsgD family transcriptional regulator/PAS domain-containing protein